MLLAQDVQAKDFEKIGYLEFRLNIGDERIIAVDASEDGGSCKFRMKYGVMAEFISSICQEARAGMWDTWSEKGPGISHAYFFGGSPDTPACKISIDRTSTQEFLVVEVPEAQAKPVLKIEYRLEMLPGPECLIALN
ncbi:MAG: hypothetical protein NTX79_02730 [Candidatus Micrarchaeota archaeon]|nr:hypothetical protein [Candidatus Micrarchaeota archaeon]